MRHAIVLGLDGRALKGVVDILRIYGFLPRDRLSGFRLTSSDVVLAFPGVLTPAAIRNTVSRIRCTAGYEPKIILLSNGLYKEENGVIIVPLYRTTLSRVISRL